MPIEVRIEQTAQRLAKEEGLDWDEMSDEGVAFYRAAAKILEGAAYEPSESNTEESKG